MIPDHVTTSVLTKTAGRNYFVQKDLSGHQELANSVHITCKGKLSQSRPLPSCVVASFLGEAFLGEMVVGHKNLKVINSFSLERIVRTFTKIADKVGKRVCKSYEGCKYVSLFSRK